MINRYFLVFNPLPIRFMRLLVGIYPIFLTFDAFLVYCYYYYYFFTYSDCPSITVLATLGLILFVRWYEAVISPNSRCSCHLWQRNNLLIENACHILDIQRLSFNKWLGGEEIYLIVYYPSGIFVTHNMKESFIVHKKPSNEGTLYIEWSTHFSRLKINTSKSILSNIWDNSMSLEEMLDFKMNY